MFINDLFNKKTVTESLRKSDTNFGSTVTHGSWVVYDGSKVKRFKSRDGAKAYAEKNGGKVASSEFYADNIQNKGMSEDAIDDRLTAQYSTPQAQAKNQALDKAFASGDQAEFDKLGVMSPQQIERDYQTMRAGEKAQDAALMKNPQLTPGARPAPATNPKGVPIKSASMYEQGISETQVRSIGGTGWFSRVLQAIRVYYPSQMNAEEFYQYSQDPRFIQILSNKSGVSTEQVKDAIESMDWGQFPEEYYDSPEDDDEDNLAEGVTSPAIKQAYADIMKTKPHTHERKAAVKKYQALRADAFDKKRQGVEEGEKSPMVKDAQKADRIRSLKNLIAIAREKDRPLRVQELESELKKLQGVAEDDDSPYMTPSAVPWQGGNLKQEPFTPPEGTTWRFGEKGRAMDDPIERQDSRHFGRFLSSVPNPIARTAGMLMRYAGQDPKEDWKTRFLKATDSAGTPDDISRQLNKKPMKEQGVAEGWKEKVAGVAIGAAALGGIGKVIQDNPNVTIDDVTYAKATTMPNRELATDLKVQTDKHGNKIYTFYYKGKHGRLRPYYYPAEKVDEQGVAEGISVVDSNYDLDQLVLTLDIEGQRKHFTYWDYDENFANAERKDVFAQLQEQPWYAGLDHPTKMEILDAAYKAIRGEEPSEYRPTVGDEPLDEAGPFSYGAKKPRKGSVADLAAQKRREQEKNKKPIEPRDQMVGTARVIKDVSEDFDDMSPHTSYVQSKRTVTSVNGKDHLSDRTASLSTDNSGNQRVRAVDGDELTINTNIPKGVNVKMIPQQGDADIDEGSVQDKLHKRHQDLRKKSGLPDPDYYKELRATYDLPDGERYAKAAELKKKYNVKESTVTNEDRERYLDEIRRAGYDVVTEAATLCPECGGVAFEDRMLAEKQDACYHKVKSRYKVWPSAYASGALVRCRKKGAKNWGNKSKK